MKTAGYVLGLGLLGIMGVGAVVDSSAPAATQSASTYTQPTYYTQGTYYSQSTYQEAQLSNDNYYTNVDGNQVHSPAYTEDNSVPAGASARCRDGKYSFSQNRRGTCSGHGGVAQWL